MEPDLKPNMSSAAFAFRGYNVTNLGRTPELLEHPAYGAIVEKHLMLAAEVFATATAKRIDLVQRVRLREETSLETYGEALCLIAGASLAQLEILKDLFGIEFKAAKLAVGYSLGEIISLVAAGVYSLEALLVPILQFSDDCVELAQNTRMGVVFSRGPILEVEQIERLCVDVTSLHQGTIGISTYLGPNTVLVLGQGASLDLLKTKLREKFGKEVHLKEDSHRWPPIHTQIVRQKFVPDRASVMLETVLGGHCVPSIPIVSCVTGHPSYNDFNSRHILADWIVQPQRLWAVLERLLVSDIDLLIHVGPEPNLIPATMNRLSNNVEEQMKSRLHLRAVSTIVRARPWLAQYISKHASLLRAPQIVNVTLEDWLLENALAAY